MIIKHKTLDFKTKGSLEFHDITDAIHEFIENSGLCDGMINIQTLHTTTAIIVNEAEPLLIEDMKKNFCQMAKKDIYYGHNDFDIRTVHMSIENEPENGHSHCLAAYLPTNVTLNIVDGKVTFGEWQRVFFIELDHERDRKVQMQLMGE
jgi:secondary thiamine-phosphate synthase enzyme